MIKKISGYEYKEICENWIVIYSGLQSEKGYQTYHRIFKDPETEKLWKVVIDLNQSFTDLKDMEDIKLIEVIETIEKRTVYKQVL